MRTAFNMFDQDGSGSIDKKEVIQLLQGEEMESIISKELIVKYMEQVDTNGDGQIDFEEF